MMIETKYDLQQIVFLQTDPDQHKRMVIGISVKPHGVLYELGLGSHSSYHYEIEISEEVNILAKTD